MSPRQGRELLDVGNRDLALRGFQRVAQLELVEGDAERVAPRIELPAAPDPTPADGCDGVGRALHRGALHVVQHAANAAHLLAAAGASRAAVNQRRQR